MSNRYSPSAPPQYSHEGPVLVIKSLSAGSVSSFSLSLEMFLLTSAEGVVEDGVAVDVGGGAVGSDVEAKTGEDIADLIFHSMLIVDCLV